MVNLEEVDAFSNLLCSAYGAMKRITFAQLAREIGTSVCSIINWHRGYVLPNESKLFKVAEVYEINLEKLTIAWKISMDAKKELKLARRNPKAKGKALVEAGVGGEVLSKALTAPKGYKGPPPAHIRYR